MLNNRFWSISDLTREFNVTPRTLRFYEDKGLLNPERDGQRRKYNSRDRARLFYVLRGKRIGLSLEEIRELLDLYDMEGGKKNQLNAALRTFEKQMEVLNSQKRDIEDAIKDLDGHIKRVSDELRILNN